MSFPGPTPISGQSSTFYKAEVTKGLLGSLFLTSCSLQAPVLSSLRSQFVFNFNEIIERKLIYKLVTSKLVVFDLKDLVCSGILLYTFRIFERRLGSRKFSSYLLNNLVISSILELVIIHFLRSYNGSDINYLPSGPTSLIFALFVKLMFEFPSPSSSILGLVPVSSKFIPYLMGLQLALTSRSSFVSAIAGFVSGLIVHSSPLLSNFMSVPSFICDWCSSIFSVVHSGKPDDGPILPGATLEIQRLQQTELLEQQIMMQSYNQMNRTPYAPIVPPPLPRTPPPMGARDGPPIVPPFPASFGASPSRSSHGAGPSLAGDDDPWSPSGIRRRGHPYALRPRPSASGGNNFEQLIHDDLDMIGGSGPRVSFPPSPSVSPIPREQIKDSAIDQLVEMGFDRDQVIQALIQSNNDVNSATNLLLS